jgi:carbonic anhydrase
MITKEAQSVMTPDEALQILKDGNDRFAEKRHNNRDLNQEVTESSHGQFPLAVLLSCIDSRTSGVLMFDLGIGDIFNARVAGNVVNSDILGSMEYACSVAGSKLIVVMGHSNCGAINAACQHVEMGNITSLLEKIQPAVEIVNQKVEDITAPESVQMVAEENVKLSIQEIRQKSDILREMEKSSSIKIVGGMYDISTGRVRFFSPDHLSLG